MVKHAKRAQARKKEVALTGNHNEFIGTPVMSGEAAGASGASRRPSRKAPAEAKAKAGPKPPRSKSNLSLEGRSSRKKAAQDADDWLRGMSDAVAEAEGLGGGGDASDGDGVFSDAGGGGAATDVPGAADEGTQSLQALPDGRLGVYQDGVLVGVVGPVDSGVKSNDGGDGSPDSSPSGGADDSEDFAEDGDGDCSPPAGDAAPVRRRLVSVRVDPLGREERPAFAEYILSLADNFEELDLINVINVARRRRARTRLMDHFRVPKLEAERLLKASYLAHQRFVALGGQEASEHLGLAFLAGRVLHEGERFAGKTPTPKKSKPGVSAEGEAVTNTSTHRKDERVPPVTPAPRSGTKYRDGTVPSKALDKVFQTLRKGLPANMAEAAVRALKQSNEGLRAGKADTSPVAPVPPVSASKLGRGYRIGEIAQMDRVYGSRVNRLGARVNSREAPEADLWPSDRAALFSPPDQDMVCIFTQR